MPQQSAPVAPTDPVIAPGQVIVNGAALSSPQAVYQGFRAQRRELARQMETIESTRADLSSRLEEPLVTGADKKGLEERITQVDARIAAIDKQLADADAQVARAAAIPGAAVDPPEPPRTVPPEAAFVLGGIFMVIVLLPLSIAFARRIWRRSAQVVTSIPRELMDRLMRVEQTVDATAIEIERIGEGQRFMTRLLSEANAPHALPAAAGHSATVNKRPGDVRL